MPYPVESKKLNHDECLDDEEFRHLISVWQTSRNTKHVLRRLRDDPDFYDTRGVWVWDTWERVENPHYDAALHERYEALRTAGATCPEARAATGVEWDDRYGGRYNPSKKRLQREIDQVLTPAHQKDIPLDVKWLRGLERKLRNMDIPLKKLKTPQSDRDLYLNADGLKNLAMSLAS